MHFLKLKKSPKLVAQRNCELNPILCTLSRKRSFSTNLYIDFSDPSKPDKDHFNSTLSHGTQEQKHCWKSNQHIPMKLIFGLKNTVKIELQIEKNTMLPRQETLIRNFNPIGLSRRKNAFNSLHSNFENENWKKSNRFHREESTSRLPKLVRNLKFENVIGCAINVCISESWFCERRKDLRIVIVKHRVKKVG